MVDKSLITQVVNSALQNDYSFFDNNFNKLINQELLKRVSADLSSVKDAIFDFDDMITMRDDYLENNPNRDDLVPLLGDKEDRREVSDLAWGKAKINLDNKRETLEGNR